MNVIAVADTHAVLWYVYASPELSNAARTWIEDAAAHGAFIGVSAISLAEIVYLIEKGKVAQDAYARLMQNIGDPQNVLKELPVTSQIIEAMRKIPYRSVPDFPDRIIAATAKAFDVPVISRDRNIRTAEIESIW